MIWPFREPASRPTGRKAFPSDTVDWSQIAIHFQPDGSLRDIYILDTSLEDWANVWKMLLADPSRLSFIADGEPLTPPSDVNKVFRLGQEHALCASYALGKQRITCHFFIKEEVELTLSPRDVDGPAEAERLAQFLAELGRATSKEVRLTPENEPASIIARYEPMSGRVVWTQSTP